MKTTLLFIGFLVYFASVVNGQVAINQDGTPPDNSAMLDVKSTTRGMLVPRMTIAQRNAIASPANGLLVFCTDNNQYFSNKGTPASPNWTMVSSQWLSSGTNIYYSSGNVGIGLSNPLQKLQVNGKISADYGSATVPSFIFGTGDENTGFSSPDVFSLGMITNGVERMRIDQTGHVFMGATTSLSTQKLYVVSNEVGASGNYADGIRALVNGVGSSGADAIAVHGIASTGATTGIGGQFEGANYGLKAISVNGGTNGVGTGIGFFSSATGTGGSITSIKSYASGTKEDVTGYLGIVEGLNQTYFVRGIDLSVAGGKSENTGINLSVNDAANADALATGIKINVIGSNNQKEKTGIDISITAPQSGGAMSGTVCGIKTHALSNNATAYGAYHFGQVHVTSGTGMEAFGSYARAWNGNHTWDPTQGTYSVYGDLTLLSPIPPPVGFFYAGYFNGNIGVMGLISPPSDQKFKENIMPVEHVLDRIKRMEPMSYNFRKGEFPQINFASGTRYGFISQDLEKLFPDVITADRFPAKYDDQGKKIFDAVQYKGIAYLEIIPILTAGIKEQQEIIEKQNNTIQSQQQQIDKLQERMAEIERLIQK